MFMRRLVLLKQKMLPLLLVLAAGSIYAQPCTAPNDSVQDLLSDLSHERYFRNSDTLITPRLYRREPLTIEQVAIGENVMWRLGDSGMVLARQERAAHSIQPVLPIACCRTQDSWITVAVAHLMDDLPARAGEPQFPAAGVRPDPWAESTELGRAFLKAQVCRMELSADSIPIWVPTAEGPAKREAAGLILADILNDAYFVNRSGLRVNRILINDFNLSDPNLWAYVEASRDGESFDVVFTVLFNFRHIPMVQTGGGKDSSLLPDQYRRVMDHPYQIFPLTTIGK